MRPFARATPFKPAYGLLLQLTGFVIMAQLAMAQPFSVDPSGVSGGGGASSGGQFSVVGSVGLLGMGDSMKGGSFATMAGFWNSVQPQYRPPFILGQPVSQTAVAGRFVSFSITATGDAPFSYQWMFNGTPVTGATNATLAFAPVQTNQAGIYFVIASNSYGAVTSAVAALVVKLAPSVLARPQSLTVSKGGSATFSVVASGDGPISYQWLFNDSLLSGATNSSLTLTGVQLNQAGGYAVMLTSPYGTTTSAAATLAVLDPPEIVLQPMPVSALAGDSVSFVVIVTGRGPFTYQWRKNGVDLPGAGGSVLTLGSITAASTGSYSVKVSNTDGSVISAAVPLTLSQRTLLVGSVQTTNLTAGSSLTLPVSLVAEGGENRVLGSIAYDSRKLSLVSVTPPVGTTLALTNDVAQGQIGFDISLPATQSFPLGSNVLAYLNFKTTASVTQCVTGVSLQGVPVTNQVLNVSGAPLPCYFVSGAVVFKSLTGYAIRAQSGATEEFLPVLNPAGSVSALTYLRISFFDLGKDSLGNVIYIINATGTNNGVPYILIPSTVAPAGTFPLNVEYYVSDRVTSPKPRLVVEIVTGGYPVVPTGVVLSADRSQFNAATGRFVVDFSSTAGKTYYIQYSSSPAGPYDTSFPGVAGTGGRLQWVDTGPPRTTSLPASVGSRFYRILQVP